MNPATGASGVVQPSLEGTLDTWELAPEGGWQRVLLKLSGEAFAGGQGLGVDPDVVSSIAAQIADVVRHGTEVAVVIGGGNYFRGAMLSERGMDRARADYIGMLGTVMNCLALQDFCEKAGVETRVQTAITMGRVDGVYDSDPRTNPDARKFETLTPSEVLARNLKVADATAISLCQENDLPIVVFNLLVEGNIARAVRGERIGTLVSTGA